MPDESESGEPDAKSPVAQWVSIIGLALGFALNRYEVTKHGHEIEQTQNQYVPTSQWNDFRKLDVQQVMIVQEHQKQQDEAIAELRREIERKTFLPHQEFLPFPKIPFAEMTNLNVRGIPIEVPPSTNRTNIVVPL